MSFQRGLTVLLTWRCECVDSHMISSWKLTEGEEPIMIQLLYSAKFLRGNIFVVFNNQIYSWKKIRWFTARCCLN